MCTVSARDSRTGQSGPGISRLMRARTRRMTKAKTKTEPCVCMRAVPPYAHGGPERARHRHLGRGPLHRENDHDTATISPDDIWLGHQDLSDRWGVPVSTIRSWRLNGYGPPGTRFGGHVRYRLSDVRHWERQRAREQAQAREAS